MMPMIVRSGSMMALLVVLSSGGSAADDVACGGSGTETSVPAGTYEGASGAGEGYAQLAALDDVLNEQCKGCGPGAVGCHPSVDYDISTGGSYLYEVVSGLSIVTFTFGGGGGTATLKCSKCAKLVAL